MFEKKRNTSAPYKDLNDATKELMKTKKKHSHIILSLSVHRQLKLYSIQNDTTISELLDEMARRFLTEKGKL